MLSGDDYSFGAFIAATGGGGDEGHHTFYQSIVSLNESMAYLFNGNGFSHRAMSKREFAHCSSPRLRPLSGKEVLMGLSENDVPYLDLSSIIRYSSSESPSSARRQNEPVEVMITITPPGEETLPLGNMSQMNNDSLPQEDIDDRLPSELMSPP